MQRFDAESLRMIIGGHAVSDFNRLPAPKRKAILTRHLVHTEAVVIGPGPLLRRWWRKNDGKPEEPDKQLRNEACEIYYGENTFIVTLGMLWEFLKHLLSHDEEDFSVAPLVGTILVDLILVDLKKERDFYMVDIESRLEDLFLFTHAKQITLRLVGGRTFDGMDTAGHELMHCVEESVERLIWKFGLRFDIKKCPEGREAEARSIKYYWSPPTEETKQRVEEGIGSFKDITQVEIAYRMEDLRSDEQRERGLERRLSLSE
ncbi:hypothetical protein FALBO_10508 [Fusarium albosuccineum]|uniref:Uncharacterized protein n=1 Tax=Fusarium albosuccineum TaxID=1237068 RepID=A0A8H4L416_9HYPO|nr:hypothetical protein FALBO_10508 [Fusarium albosuccineum]